MALCLAIDKDNQVWVGTAGKGLFRIKNDTPEQPLVNKPEANIETAAIINQPISKSNHEAVITNKKSAIAITKKSKKKKNKPKRKRFSMFNNNTNNTKTEGDQKTDFAKNRQTNTIKSNKNENENPA